MLPISFNFEKRNMKWKKVKNYLANHYPKIEGTRQTRTGIVFKPDPHIIHIPKNVQLEQRRICQTIQYDYKETGYQYAYTTSYL